MNLFDDETQIEFCSSFVIFLLFVSVFFQLWFATAVFSVSLVLIQIGRWVLLKRNGSSFGRPIRKINDEELRKWIV